MQQTESLTVKKFGKRIKELRRQKGYTLNAIVFERGGLSTATWSRVENGLVNPKLTTLIKVAAVLGMTIQEIFEELEIDYTIEEE